MGVKMGDTVVVHYVGSLNDGTKFDSSLEREPIEFVVGDENLIAGFHEAVLGKNAGDQVVVAISPEKAFGERSEELILTVPKSELPEGLEPEVGLFLQLSTDHGDVEVPIVGISDTHVDLDANHPLAGETLNFTIDIISVQPA